MTKPKPKKPNPREAQQEIHLTEEIHLYSGVTYTLTQPDSKQPDLWQFTLQSGTMGRCIGKLGCIHLAQQALDGLKG